MRPLVSVILPVYNQQNFIAETIESVLSQTFRDFEFLILDDGSTDRSAEIIKSYAEKDNRIKAYFEKVYPEMDFERVYGSDMKKMIKWFAVLNANNIEIKLSEAEAEDTETAEKPAAAEKKTSTTNKTSSPKAAAVKNAPTKKINTPRKMA